MQPRRYCKAILLLTLCGAVLVALFNLLVDPLNSYPKFHLKAFDGLRGRQTGRIARAELARRGEWEMAIFGTSRPKAGMPADHPAFATNRVCNIAVDAARMSEVAKMFDYTRRHNALRRVLLCLDFAMFRASTFYRFDFDDSRFNPNLSLFEFHCKNLLGADAFSRSFGLTTDLIQKDFPPEGSRDGFHVRSLRPGTSQRVLFDKSLRALAYGYASQKIATNEMQGLHDVLAACHEHHIRLTLAINPVHGLDLELLVAGDNWSRFEQWKRDVVAMVAREDPEAVLWDFTGYWKPTAEEVPAPGDTTTRMKFYFENSHYTPAMGAFILDRMFLGATNDFGVILTTTNLEAHLGKIRSQREQWANSHGIDVQWVQRISTQALTTRKKNSAADEEIE
jgi:hypothetical protein